MRLTKKKKAEILRKTRELLDRPKGWTKHTFSRPISKGPDAFPYMHAYCVAGAAYKASRILYGYDADLSEAELVKALSIDALARARLASEGVEVAEDEVATYLYNDRSTTRKKDVISLIDEKLAEIEAKKALVTA